jgi:hypothetical protein
LPDRHPHGVFDQGRHGDADPGLAQNYFLERQGAVMGTAIGYR